MQKRNPTIDIALGVPSAVKAPVPPRHGYEDVFALVNRHHEETRRLQRGTPAPRPEPAKKAR